MTRAVEGMKAGIEDFTGHRPVTCPWRAMYDPMVIQAIRIAVMSSSGMSGGAIDDDTPAVWLDAALAYTTARDAVSGRDRRDEHKRRMRKANQR